MGQGDLGVAGLACAGPITALALILRVDRST